MISEKGKKIQDDISDKMIYTIPLHFIIQKRKKIKTNCRHYSGSITNNMTIVIILSFVLLPVAPKIYQEQRIDR